MLKRMFGVGLAAATLSATLVSPSHAEVRQCRLAENQGNAAVIGYYDARTGQIDEMSGKGIKTDDLKVKVPLANGGEEWLTLSQVRQRLADEKTAALKEVANAVDDCERGFKPYQDVMNDFVTIGTAGLSKLLPAPMTRVDVSDILAGYPLGGPDAFIPKLREQLLHGDRGTIANIVRDPWKCITFQRKC